MLRRLTLAGFTLAACLAITVRADDVVIFKDGYKLQGRRFKEQQVLSDAQNGVVVQVAAGKGFDIIDDGSRFIIFSSNSRQLGAEIPDVQATAGKDYDKTIRIKSLLDLPQSGQLVFPEFDKNWKRKAKVNTGNGNFQLIEQDVFKLNPKRILIASPTHKWQIVYGIKEWRPEQIRTLLSNHPSLVEKDGKPDPAKRLEIALFLKQAGWLDEARAELDKAKADIPADQWAKDQTERAEHLRAEIATLVNQKSVDELETAVSSGRYQAAAGWLTKFDDKIATATDTKRFSSLKATVENVAPRYEKSRRLLRDALDDLGDAGRVAPFAAAGGGAMVATIRQQADGQTLTLLDAGERVWAELHPDTAGRVELFLNQAVQAETQRKAGKPTTATSARLVALAVTGWVLGKNGADPSAEAAVRVWNYRQLLLDYQTEDTQNARRVIVKKYAGNEKLTPDVLSQVISLLPPPAPAVGGMAVPPNQQTVPGLIRRTTRPTPEAAAGVEYVLRLPPEYHHGRPYPVLLAFTHPGGAGQLGLAPEALVSLLAADADRYGYIVAAPVWVKPGDKPYDYHGDRHYFATAVLRDLLRSYRVDNDRVFPFGLGDGGNLALDVGLAHPDLFAGVVAMASYPRSHGFLMHYWQNAQKLPIYAVNGNLNGNAYKNLRDLFEKWMPRGFPAIMSVYRGRTLEWFGGELPPIFDWMGRKKRVTGTASLRLNTFAVEPWQIMRDGDNRFYWVGTESVARLNTLEANEGKSFIPAQISADIRSGNQIVINTRGLKNVVVWLERDMIDWTKPVSVQLNGSSPRGYKAKVIEPDPDVMLENLYRHGDRTMLFLNKLEFDAIP